MLQNVSLVGMVTFLRLAKFLAQCAFAGGFWGLTWLSLVVAREGIPSGTPEPLQTELSTLVGPPTALAMLAASICFIVIRAFSATIDGAPKRGFGY
mmetsp:Transcript_166328/g.528428  ORF Transcript_166328/g.528428 Transcript_166328/m.528428 type:complete len:96 (-) Transcript_166328:128-415(-)